MKLGVVFPQTEMAGDVEGARRIVEAAESAGFDYLLAYDHVLGAVHEGREPKLTGPYTEHHPFHDPFVLFAYAAGMTRRLEFATGVLVLPQRQTALVARQAADLDLLSGGRLRLGVGTGWNYVEYEALGQDFASRGRRLSEQIGLLRELWGSPMVSFEGAFDRVDRATLHPRPSRQIPIWLGGFTEVAFRRAAELGDGFIFAGTFDYGAGGWAKLKPLLEAAGRDPASFGRDLIVHMRPTARETADDLKAWRDLGGTHACIGSMGKGFAGAAAHIAFFEEVKRLLDR
jgi:probable F420-dependent oxidoreductase